MSIGRALASSVFDETLWFKTNLVSALGDCSYYLIKKNGQVSSNCTQLTEHHSFELQAEIRALNLQHSKVERLLLKNGSKICWVLPLGKESTLFECLILVNVPENFEPSDINALYYKLLYQLKSFHFTEMSSQLQVAKEWIREEINEITRLQQLMLPDKDLQLESVDMAYTYKAFKGAGGDYLDIVALGQRNAGLKGDVGMIVADVSGHGPAAAVETAMIDAILRTVEPKNVETSSSEVLGYINQHFFTKKPRGSFLTATVFRYNAQQKELIYANAGHPHAYLKKQDRLVALDQGGIPIGVLHEQQWDTYRLNVEVGDTLFVYTDVVIETQNSQREQFGFERLENALIASPRKPALMLEYLEEQMRLFCGCSEFQDDLTMCAIQFI